MRTYKPEFLALGFIETMDEHGIPRPQCLICTNVLSNESLKHNKLQRHLERVHPRFSNKPIEFWKEKESQVKSDELDSVPTASTTYASFEVALSIARYRKSYKIGDELIKPAVKIIVGSLCGEATAKKLDALQISESDIKEKLNIMGTDILEQLMCDLITTKKFSLHVEFIEIEELQYIMVYVRYKLKQNFNNEFLLCENLSTIDCAFSIITSFLEEYELNWNYCVSICTDGSPVAMELCRQVQNKNKQLVSLHCILHTGYLIPNDPRHSLTRALSEILCVIDIIKSSKIFHVMCEEMGLDHEHLLNYKDTRLIFKGEMLACVMSLKLEIEKYLQNKNHELAYRFKDVKWLTNISYLIDLFQHINQVNFKMKDDNCTVFDIHENITVFINKTKLWQEKMANSQFAAFPTLNMFLEDLSDKDYKNVIKKYIPIFIDHLKSLENNMVKFMPLNIKFEEHSWVRNPFEVDAYNINTTVEMLPEELLELQGNRVLKERFDRLGLEKFWATMTEKLVLSKEAENALLPLPTLSLSEAGLICLSIMHNKNKDQLCSEKELRCALSQNIAPRINDICRESTL